MQRIEETIRSLAPIPNLTVSRDVPLSRLTRLGIGGPASVLVETGSGESLASAIRIVRESDVPWVVMGGGTNLVVSDDGFRGVVLRYTAGGLEANGNAVSAGSGAELQALVDFAVSNGLGGIETLTGIPGSVGAAVYGNAGAYGHSLSEFVSRVRFCDGGNVREFNNADCEFRYRESVFKRNKEWIILGVTLELMPAPAEDLRRAAAEIREIRDSKYPATMRCAGSIFKNLLLAELPERAAAGTPSSVVREGKVPSAYFLEQVGAKDMRRGGMRVAGYHANLIYNEGGGTAADLRSLIDELKERVRARFGLELEEEVQYVGF